MSKKIILFSHNNNKEKIVEYLAFQLSEQHIFPTENEYEI